MASSLVQDTELNANVSPTYTEHYFDRRRRSGGPREVWTRKSRLGSGSFGTVWLEECTQLYRAGTPSLRAVKEIRIQAGAGQGLDYNRELEAFAKFSQPKFDPYFIRSYGWYRTNNAVFITMAYCPLGDLQQYLFRPLPEAEAGQIMCQILEGLRHMHDNGFAHRDLKPKNILVASQGPYWRVQITDFGIAKKIQDGQTSQYTMGQGTHGFMAPEMIIPSLQGPAYAVDMWSLGSMTYYVLTNRLPISGLHDLYQYGSGTVDNIASDYSTVVVTQEAKDFVSRLLARNAKDRPTAEEALSSEWMNGIQVSSGSPGEVQSIQDAFGALDVGDGHGTNNRGNLTPYLPSNTWTSNPASSYTAVPASGIASNTWRSNSQTESTVSPTRQLASARFRPTPETASRNNNNPKFARADDERAMREFLLIPLPEEPKILDDVTYHWTVGPWRSMGKWEHSPMFQAGGYPWRILLHPEGDNVDQCSIYLEHGCEPKSVPKNWSCCVQFALLLWNPNDPSVYAYRHAHHRFTMKASDLGFMRFVELRKMFDVPWEGSDRPLCENGMANVSAYVRVVEDETGVLWRNLQNYNSKKETGYVGLKNQGETAYLNTVLQSFYFLNEFRKAIYGMPTREAETSDTIYALQRLFYQLQTSEDAVSSAELTRSFGWVPAQVSKAQDIVRFSNVLLELVEIKMKGTIQENVLPRMFSGKIKTHISCINVDYERSRVEDFWDIDLHVRGNSNLFDSLRSYIQVSRMDGETQYYAGDKYKFQDAEMRMIFMSFPDVLRLQLKRYKYDSSEDTMVKVYDRYEFPEVFDASPYLAEDANMSEPWTYQLHGVLVHDGSLEAGHNYAFLRPNRNGRFYKFDDDKVTKATMREVLVGNFGGEIRMPSRPRAPMQETRQMRQNSAYVLVYIRQCRLDKVLTPVTAADIPAHLQKKSTLRATSVLPSSSDEQPNRQHGFGL